MTTENNNNKKEQENLHANRFFRLCLDNIKEKYLGNGFFLIHCKFHGMKIFEAIQMCDTARFDI